MPDPDDLHKRLEQLNRGPLTDGGAADDELRRRLRKGLRSRGSARPPSGPPRRGEPIVFHRDVPHRPAPAAPGAGPAGRFVALESAVEGVEVVAPGGERAFLVERPVGGPGSDWPDLCDELADALRDGSALRGQLARLGRVGARRPEELIFIDLETTGLGSSPLFLIGAMVWEAGRLVVRQFLARDYSEERPAVELFLELAAGRKVLVSFNGKSFDLPFLRMRAAANALACPFDPPHLDLLHVARRIWRGELPNCRLQTIEHHVCGRLRTGDIPGHLIPDAYHSYVRTGNAAQMAAVLEHNFLDLVTLAEIAVRMDLPGVP